jgi:hypothetical protein
MGFFTVKKGTKFKMKEILTCDQNNWTNNKVTVVIDRETGEFNLFGSRFKLNLQDNKATLIKNDGKVPICIGYLHKNTWYFEGQDIVREDKDPFVAVVQVLCNIFQ